MAVTSKLYGRFWQSMGNKEIDLDTDTFKVMLCSNLYTPDQDSHRYKSDVTGEITGTGYTAGGISIGSLTVNYDGTSNTFSFDGVDAVWNNSTLTARYAVLYDSTPASDAARPLVGYVDFGADVSSTSAAFTVSWDPTGIGAVVTA